MAICPICQGSSDEVPSCSGSHAKGIAAALAKRRLLTLTSERRREIARNAIRARKARPIKSA